MNLPDAIDAAASELSGMIADDETGQIAEIRMKLLSALFEYTTNEPLVLEAVDCDKSIILFDDWDEGESIQYKGQCYRLPEGET